MYRFDKVEAAQLTQIQSAWMAYATDNPSNVSLSFYEGCFATCMKHADGSMEVGDGASAIYGVFPIEAADADSSECAALVAMTHAGKNSDQPWLKVQTMYVEPALNVADQEPDFGKLAWIAATAVIGSLALTYEDMPANELKIWATVPMTKEFLTSVSTALLKDHADKFDVSGHGNWLIVRKK